jgi:nucleotide-binding universal stress UspA family protein
MGYDISHRSEDMFKKIIVPVDGSEGSEKAIQFACDIVKKFRSELTLLCVVPQPILFGVEAGIVDFRPLENAGKDILDSSKKIAKEKGLTPDTRLDVGQAADKIIQIAKDENFDLIVIGSRGMSTVKSFLLGSVSNKVSHHASCPVLIVR